jgi:hypothetical protein
MTATTGDYFEAVFLGVLQGLFDLRFWGVASSS